MRIHIILAATVCVLTIGAASAADNTPAAPHAVLNNEGVSAMLKNNFELSEQKFKEALRIEPNYVYGIENYAILMNNRALTEPPDTAWKDFHYSFYLGGSPNTKKSLDALALARGTNPAQFEARIKEAEKAKAANDVVTAIVEYEFALQIKDDPAVKQALSQLKVPAGTPLRLVDLKTSTASNASPETTAQFGPFMRNLERQIKAQWRPQSRDVKEAVVLDFQVHKDGRVTDIRVNRSSNDLEQDQAAITALKAAAPFPGIPANLKMDSVPIRFHFDYNPYKPATPAAQLQTNKPVPNKFPQK